MNLGLVARDDATAEFLDAAAHGEFLIQRCGACGRHSGPQAQQCHACGATELSWVPASGRATIVTWASANTLSAALQPASHRARFGPAAWILRSGWNADHQLRPLRGIARAGLGAHEHVKAFEIVGSVASRLHEPRARAAHGEARETGGERVRSQCSTGDLHVVKVSTPPGRHPNVLSTMKRGVFESQSRHLAARTRKSRRDQSRACSFWRFSSCSRHGCGTVAWRSRAVSPP